MKFGSQISPVTSSHWEGHIWISGWPLAPRYVAAHRHGAAVRAARRLRGPSWKEASVQRPNGNGWYRHNMIFQQVEDTLSETNSELTPEIDGFGILVFLFWDGLFLGVMLVLGRIKLKDTIY